VQCVDDSTCGGNSCIRTQRTCSTVKIGSIKTCGPCEADGQCVTGDKCVELSFGSKLVGNYCLPSRPSAGCATRTNLTLRPFSTEKRVTSIDGVSGAVCYPPTTCEAVDQASAGGTNCTVNDSCGAADVVDDGYCSSVGCTYFCSADRGNADCPSQGFRTCTSGICGP
jgi:hypothetical protein